MSFSECHPLTLFIYFGVVTGSLIIERNPVFSLLNLLFVFIYRCIRLKNLKLLRGVLFYAVITGLFTVFIPLFSHNGVTPLLFIGSNGITAEAIFLGLSVGFQVSAIMCWLGCMADVLSGEKIIFLISLISSRFGIFLSRAVRFVPMAREQFKNIYRAQKNILPGRKTVGRKIKLFFGSISALFTWIIESSANVSDSMYARGYGLSGRKSVNIYHFRLIDSRIVIMVGITLLLTAATVVFGKESIRFYPETDMPDFSFTLLLYYVSWIIIMLIPYITELCEEYRWKLLRSKI